MKKIDFQFFCKNNRLLLIVAVAIFLGGVICLTNSMYTTYHAHDMFDGYCEWRGLTVASKSDNYGYCENKQTGQKYKIVLFEGRWFLDGDLPCGFMCF